MTTPAQVRRIAASLGVEVRHPSIFPAHIDGVPVEPIRDTVLCELAEFRDWREYDGLMRLPEVFDPWQHVMSCVFAAPFEVQPARSTPAAKVLAEKARWIWGRMPASDRQIVLQRILDAEWYGWRPMQCVLQSATWPGSGPDSRQTWWVPGRIVDKPPHHFRFTAEPVRRLVFLQGAGHRPVVYSPEEIRAGWLTPRVRTLDDPYGLGLGYFAWMIARAGFMIHRKFYNAVDREWNLKKVVIQNIAQAKPLREELDTIREDLEMLLEMLTDNSILLEAGKFKTEFVEKLQFIQSGVALMEHVRKSLQLLFQGGHLTSETSTAGPSGSAKVHQQAEKDYALMRISCVENAVSELFANMFWLNGEDADFEDQPRFVSTLRFRLRESTVQTLFNLGAPLQGHRVAELLGAPGLLASEEEVVLQKVSSPNITLAQATEEPPPESDGS